MHYFWIVFWVGVKLSLVGLAAVLLMEFEEMKYKAKLWDKLQEDIRRRSYGHKS